MSKNNEAMIDIIKALIQEVKEEKKKGMITESFVREETANMVERKAIKKYITENLIKTLKHSEK
jgi:hypothetical protein